MLIAFAILLGAVLAAVVVIMVESRKEGPTWQNENGKWSAFNPDDESEHDDNP